ncbi:MAG TPA: glycyl-radical enzyme activating protein [Thermoflexia bacterium]|nr:glycyl-radical enzyme activating protein [Thermoflexia bacterium]
MQKGTVFDIKRFSIHDGPGIRTTVFLKGCPLRCWWCHNPESQDPRPELILRAERCIGCGACVEACEAGAIYVEDGRIYTDRTRCTRCGACTEVCYAEAREMAGQEMSVEAVMAEIERDVTFYDTSGGGVTFSGGEPLTQPDFLLALLRACRERGIHTAVDTCGYGPWETMAAVAEETDLLLYDLKLMDEAKHRRYTGVSNRPILDNLRRLAERGTPIFLRVPIVPGINDSEEELRRLAAFAANLPNVNRVDLLPYHPTGKGKYERLGRDYPLPDLHSPSEERMQEIAHLLEDLGLDVGIGG